MTNSNAADRPAPITIEALLAELDSVSDEALFLSRLNALRAARGAELSSLAYSFYTRTVSVTRWGVTASICHDMHSERPFETVFRNAEDGSEIPLAEVPNEAYFGLRSALRNADTQSVLDYHFLYHEAEVRHDRIIARFFEEQGVDPSDYADR